MAGSVFLVVVLLLLGACGGEEITPPTGAGDTSDARVSGAGDALRALQRGIAARDASSVEALAAPDASSRAAVATLYANAVALRLAAPTFRFVDDGAGNPPDRLERYGLDAWTGTVAVAWRVGGFDAAPSREDTRFSFVQVGSRTRIAAVGGGDDREPLWLVERLDVVRTRDTLVMVSTGAGRSAGWFSARAVRAVSDVRRVLPSWRGRLVVEVPSSEDVLESVLGTEQGHYRAIAGVTTTVDGRRSRSSPVHVFLNPGVYDGLGGAGAQVVLSHESTHVATRAPFADLPTWLLEGFADYVALDHADVPLATAARQIFARVRRDGPPASLPSGDDLSPSAPGLGATYEEAWTVCRYIGQEYGEQQLVRLYDTVDGGTPVASAFRSVLGVSQRTVVQGWRTDLSGLARANAPTRSGGTAALPREG